MKPFYSNYWVKQLGGLMRLLLVLVGFALSGWVLNGFSASVTACIGTLAVCGYLGWVGSGGVTLASMWVVGLMSVAAINQRWLHGLPRPRFTHIPLTLLISWLFALCIVWQFGKVVDFTRQAGIPKSLGFGGMMCLVVGSLSFGWRIYPETLFYLTLFFL